MKASRPYDASVTVLLRTRSTDDADFLTTFKEISRVFGMHLGTRLKRDDPLENNAALHDPLLTSTALVVSFGIGQDPEAVNISIAVFGCEQSGRYQSPHTTAEVDCRGLHDVIDPEPAPNVHREVTVARLIIVICTRKVSARAWHRRCTSVPIKARDMFN